MRDYFRKIIAKRVDQSELNEQPTGMVKEISEHCCILVSQFCCSKRKIRGGGGGENVGLIHFHLHTGRIKYHQKLIVTLPRSCAPIVII